MREMVMFLTLDPAADAWDSTDWRAIADDDAVRAMVSPPCRRATARRQ